MQGRSSSRHSIIAFFIALSALLSGPALGAPARAGEGVYCEFTMTVAMPSRPMGGRSSSGGGIPDTIRGRIWRSGEYVRQELDLGGKRTQVQIATPTELLTLLPREKIVQKRPMTAQLSRTMRVNGTPLLLVTPCNPGDYWKSARKAGSEKIGATTCTLWEAELPGSSQGTIRLWLPSSKPKALPLRYEVSMSMPAMGGGIMGGGSSRRGTMTRTVSVTTSRREKNIPVSRFRAPKDYLVREEPLPRKVPPVTTRTRASGSAAPSKPASP